MALEIVSIGGVDILAQMFNAIAAMTSNLTFFSLMGIAEIIGVAACVVSYIKTHDLQKMGIWMIFFVIINGLLLSPKVDLLITDRTSVKVKKVDNVPVGVATPFYLFSVSGTALAEMYDKLLSQPNDVQYTRTGMLFGQRLLDRSFNIVSNSSTFDSNMANFTNSCIVPDIEINRKYDYQDFYNSKNLFEFFLSNPKFRHSENRHVYYNNGTTSEYITCLEGSKKIKADLEKVVQDKINKPRANSEKYYQNPTATNVPQAMLQSVHGFLMQTSGNSTDIYKQNILVNTLRRNMQNLPASFDGSADMIAIASEQSLAKMRLANLSSYQVASKTLPALYTVFSTLLVGIFPIIILAMFVTELTISIIKSYFGFLFSLMLYPVLFSILNSIVNTLTYQQLGGESFTISNADTLRATLSDIGGTASYLMWSIPFISFGLIKGLGQAVSSAGSYLGNAFASTTSADATQVAAGNYNYGNMQMENVNGFKRDLNSAFRSGMHTQQLANGAIENKMSDGSYSYDASSGLSKLPFSVNWSNAISSSWNERTSMAISEEARNSNGVRESLTNALSRLSGFNSGTTHTETRGKDWADNDGVNKVTNVGNRTSSGTNESISHDKSTGKQSSEDVQAEAKLSAGISWFGNGASASVGTSARDSEVASDNRANADRKHIETMINNGESLDKIDGYIESVKGGYSDSTFYTVLNNVQNDIRQANERYHDYVEVESKSLNNVKESILSNTENVQVSRQLDSAVYRYMKDNFSDKELELALNTSPSKAGIELQNRAIQAVTGQYIDGIVSSHHSNAETLVSSFSKHEVNNVSGVNSIRNTPDLNDGYSSLSEQHDKAYYGSSKKERLNSEFEKAQQDAVSGHYEKRNNIDNDKKIIDEKSKDVAKIVKSDRDDSNNSKPEYITGPHGRRIYKDKK